MEEETDVAAHRKTKRKAGLTTYCTLAVCALTCAVAVSALEPAYAAGSSAETEIGVMFIEEPQENEQGGDPSNPGSNQEGQQNQQNETNLPQKDASDGLLAGGEDGPYWLQATGDVVSRASGVLAVIAAAAALACLVAALRIGKGGRHAR